MLNWTELKEKIEKGEPVFLKVKVMASSVETDFLAPMADGTLKLALKEAARAGQANQALIKFWQKQLRPLAVEIKIVSGRTSRLKLLKIIKSK